MGVVGGPRRSGGVGGLQRLPALPVSGQQSWTAAGPHLRCEAAASIAALRSFVMPAGGRAGGGAMAQQFKVQPQAHALQPARRVRRPPTLPTRPTTAGPARLRCAAPTCKVAQARDDHRVERLLAGHAVRRQPAAAVRVAGAWRDLSAAT